MTTPATLIYGCEGETVPRPVSRDDLSPSLRAEIRALQRIEPWRNLRRLAAFLALAGSGTALILLVPGAVARALGSVLTGGALVGLSVLMHEGCHLLLFRSRRLSRLVGFCCGAPVLISVSAYRALHLRHHSFERTEQDPDDIERVARKPIPLVLVYYVLLVVGAYLYLPHVAIVGLRVSRSNRELLRIVGEYLLIAGLLGAGWVYAPDALLRAWLIPMILAAQITNLRSIAEHGLTTGDNPFTASRSVRSNRVVSFFFCNLNYHLEHHLFPAVPWYNLPRLHHLLLPAYRGAGSSIYPSYLQFLTDFVRTSWSGLIPNVRLLPAHLRDELCD